MKQKGTIFDKVALGVDLPGESVPGQPLVEITGENRVIVENHKGVTGYGCNQIHVKVAYGALCICGSGLKLARMSKHQLVITGRIDGVSILRRGK